jgi:hypothetical protein
MQKWEYLEVKRVSETSMAYWIVRSGPPVKPSEYLDNVRMLNTFGNEGWELVCVFGLCFYFKRPFSD